MLIIHLPTGFASSWKPMALSLGNIIVQQQSFVDSFSANEFHFNLKIFTNYKNEKYIVNSYCKYENQLTLFWFSIYVFSWNILIWWTNNCATFLNTIYIIFEFLTKFTTIIIQYIYKVYTCHRMCYTDWKYSNCLYCVLAMQQLKTTVIRYPQYYDVCQLLYDYTMQQQNGSYIRSISHSNKLTLFYPQSGSLKHHSFFTQLSCEKPSTNMYKCTTICWH